MTSRSTAWSYPKVHPPFNHLTVKRHWPPFLPLMVTIESVTEALPALQTLFAERLQPSGAVQELETTERFLPAR
jgi:hypothetical protein